VPTIETLSELAAAYGNPAIVGIYPLDRWLCVPEFQRVCPYRICFYQNEAGCATRFPNYRRQLLRHRQLARNLLWERNYVKKTIQVCKSGSRPTVASALELHGTGPGDDYRSRQVFASDSDLCSSFASPFASISGESLLSLYASLMRNAATVPVRYQKRIEIALFSCIL